MIKIQSTPLTFIDQTDTRKLEVYIKSNLPTIQIYNSNSGAYTPNWVEGDNLELKVDVFLDSRIMTDSEYNATDIKWYKNDIEMIDGTTEDISDDKKKLTIKDNILKDTPIIIYTCKATYQGISSLSHITFARVDTGLNGEKGSDGTSVRILGNAKSVSVIPNTSYYTITYDTGAIVAAALGDAYVYSGELYVCSILNGGDDGKTDYFVNVGKIQGEAAKSLTLLGNAQVFHIDKNNKPSPSTIDITAHTVNLTNEQKSTIDWKYRTTTNGTWNSIAGNLVSMSNGGVKIDGNAFKDFTNSDIISIRAVFKDNDITYQDIFTVYKTYDGIDGEKGNPGDDAPIVFLSNEHISFVADANGNVNGQTVYTSVVGYEGTTKVRPQIGDLSITNAGLDIIGMHVEIDQELTDKSDNEVVLKISVSSKVGDKTNNLGSVLSNNGNFPILINSPAIVALQLNWTKVNAGPEGEAGVGISSVSVKYGTTETSITRPADDKWTETIPSVPEGHYLWTRTTIDYTEPDRQDTVTYTYAKQGEKGDTGTSVSKVDIAYAIHSNATNYPSTGWTSTIPAATPDKQYLWTRTTFTLDDGKTNSAYSVVKQGRGISSVVENYLASASSSGVTASTSGWTTTIQTIDASKRYLWNYETITYTDNTTTATTPVIIGVFGNTGGTGPQGKGIKSITEYYLATASASDVTISTTGWTTTMQTITATNKYLWNYELITYTDDSTESLLPVIIGVYGDKGDTGAAGADAYTVLLTNESHVFAGSTSAAIASSTTTQVLSYKGATSQSATIVSVNGVAASTASTATGIAGLSFQCNALSGTSPTITFTCTTAFVSPSGTIPIVIKVGSISITKMFTYSIAFKGATGGQGNPGAPSSSYWLVSNASAVQKTSSGDILCTPATLTFTGRIQTGTSAPTNYAARWILAYSTDGSTYTDSYTSTANEATASIAASATYKAVRARMYLAGGTTTLLDEQIIPFVSDGETGAPGATGDNAVTFQVYSNNGYALSTSIPTILLQTFAYFGDVEITSGATFQWYRHNGTAWVAVSDATNAYFNVSRDDVSFSNNYMCKMQFNGTEYVGVVTIDDKNDENKVFASKPSNYFAGDLWIVGTDYIPGSYTIGTMLRSEHTNIAYTDSDWVPATKYDEEIEDLKTTVESYKQYFSVNSTNGLQIGNSSINNDVLTTNRVETSIINSDVANVETINVTGRYSGSTMLQAPILNLGNFSFVIEGNGSLSIVANT